MPRLAVACYVLAVLALALSLQAGWPAAVVAVAALAAAAGLMAVEHRRSTRLMDAAQGVADARAEAMKAAEDVKRLRTELQAALERLTKQPRGY